MLQKLALLLLTIVMTGCRVLDPVVEVPAPPDELQKVIETFDRINNPAGIQCRSYMTRFTASPENIQLKMTMVGYGDLEKKCIRNTTTVPGFPTQVELFDGKKAYSIIPGVQTKVLTGESLAFLRYSAIHTKPWSCLKEEYEKITLDEQTFIINGRECFRLVARPAGAPELSPVELFIDKKTFYPVQAKTVTPTELGRIPVTIDYLKFRQVDGALVGEKLKIRQMNMTVLVELQEIKINCPIPEKTFNAEMIADEED